MRLGSRRRRPRSLIASCLDLVIAIAGLAGLVCRSSGGPFGGFGLDRGFRLAHLRQAALTSLQFRGQFVTAPIDPELGVLRGIDCFGLSQQSGDFGFNFGDPCHQATI